MKWLFGLDKSQKTVSKPKKPPFQYAKQLSDIQKRKKALEQELAELIVAEQQLLKLKEVRNENLHRFLSHQQSPGTIDNDRYSREQTAFNTKMATPAPWKVHRGHSRSSDKCLN
jgi:hypothetical protein